MGPRQSLLTLNTQPGTQLAADRASVLKPPPISAIRGRRVLHLGLRCFPVGRRGEC